MLIMLKLMFSFKIRMTHRPLSLSTNPITYSGTSFQLLSTLKTEILNKSKVITSAMTSVCAIKINALRAVMEDTGLQI